MTTPRPRKIIHVDMDAFYASVEQRDDPLLRGRPVVVAWRGSRSVVCAASYEARRYGVRSAMPALRAERLCPDAVFVPPDFTRYRAASRQVRAIFLRHTDLVEPLSLDEAYLDVTENRLGLPSATEVAQVIRQSIREELSLTASAGSASAAPVSGTAVGFAVLVTSIPGCCSTSCPAPAARSPAPRARTGRGAYSRMSGTRPTRGIRGRTWCKALPINRLLARYATCFPRQHLRRPEKGELTED